MRSKTSVLLFVLGASCVLLAQDGYRRDQFGEVAATAMEHVARQLYGTVRIRWEDRVWFVDELGRTREVGFPGFLQTPVSGGYVFATCLDFPQERHEAIQRFGKFESVAPIPATSVVVLRSNVLGNVLDLRTGQFFQSPTLTQCMGIEVVGLPPAPRMPLLRVQYASFHRGNDWTGGLEWLATLDTDAMSTTERLPTRLWKTYRSGKAVRERLRVLEAAVGAVDVLSTTTGYSVRVRCAKPCVMSPTELLSAEW
jgi:hypothetical protein